MEAISNYDELLAKPARSPGMHQRRFDPASGSAISTLRMNTTCDATSVITSTDRPAFLARNRTGSATIRLLQNADDIVETGLRSGDHPHWIASTAQKPRPFIIGGPNPPAGAASRQRLTRKYPFTTPHMADRDSRRYHLSWGGSLGTGAR